MINYPEKDRVGGESGEPGAFLVKDYKNTKIFVVASDRLGWDHVSVSLSDRCPTWEEMCYIKNIFWLPESWVMQLHPPVKDNISTCDTCLHLWAPNSGRTIPIPPILMV